ncbi:MAG: HAMP domain-containing histidine kinase [Akkermansiaceae bacterium]|nr:HAMP domain-containing histidine kinase [Akkermansiaceae bacterium]
MRDGEAESLAAVLGSLGFAVLRRRPAGDAGAGRWELAGPCPAWFAAVFGRPEDTDFLERSPFLADFLDRDFAAAAPGAEPWRSGLWEERVPVSDGASEAGPAWFEATVTRIDDGAEFLLIERADERHAQERRFTQRFHDDALEKRRLAKEIEKKEILLDCIVHDLSGPLATILMNLQHVSRRLDRDDLRRALERATAQAERQRALIRSIADVFAADLPLPRLGAALGLKSGPGESPDAAAVVRQIAEAHESTAAARGIGLVFSTDPPEGDFAVVGETGQLGRVVENLLANALRHSPEGGRVAVAVESEKDGVSVSVTDEGPGVAPELADRLFRPFARGSVEDGGQAGLGLYFCRMIVDLWGGRIGYSPGKSGRGACFRFVLPRARTVSAEKGGAGDS